MLSLHILLPLLLSYLSLVAAQDCDGSDPFGDGCDDSAPAIAIDGTLTLCNEVLTSCPGGFPAAASCVTNYCQLGCGDTNNCCSSSNPSSCFQSSFGTTNSSSSGSGSGSEAQDPGLAECTSVGDYISYCQTATPGFSTLPNTAQASCFCFNENGSYNGTAFDDAATSCYAAMATQTTYSTSELSAYSAIVVGACTKFVDAGVLSSAGAAATAAPGASSSSSSSTATMASSASSGSQAGTTSPTTTASSAKSGANKGSEGCGILLGAFLAVSCVLASL